MKERPIIFNTEMVRAILDGRKTQTRRVVTSKTSDIGECGDWSKLCWDGSAIYTFPELTNYTPIKKQEKAPLPFVDDGFWKKDHSAAMYLHVPYNWEDDMTIYRIYCKYDVGDRLWVRETWCAGCTNEPERCACYKVLDDGRLPKFFPSCRESVVKPSIFMPRWASRITLEITEIRVERLQEISYEDMVEEGASKKKIAKLQYPTTRESMLPWFQNLWNRLNGGRGYSWESNPWVWVIGFKRT
jgi:hypothetical protein